VLNPSIDVTSISIIRKEYRGIHFDFVSCRCRFLESRKYLGPYREIGRVCRTLKTLEKAYQDGGSILTMANRGVLFQVVLDLRMQIQMSLGYHNPMSSMEFLNSKKNLISDFATGYTEYLCNDSLRISDDSITR
jgi:hypothetical protein